MKLIEKFVVREVGGSIVAVATGKASVKFKGVIKLNEVSKFIFEKLLVDTTEQAIVDAITAEYDVDRETASKDVKEFIEQLNGAGILE